MAVLQLLVIAVYGQYSLSGTVKSSKGDLLPWASVKIRNLYKGTATGPDGKFVFEGLGSGNYTVEVSYLGYLTSSTKVSLEKNQEISVVLEKSNFTTEEVLIQSTRAGYKTPVAYSEIDQDELQQLNTGEDIPFLLALSPSVVETSETGIGLGYTGLRVRGTDASRINVTMNGIPLNDAESQGVFWVNMPDFANSVENIQIQRGVGTSTNGAGAFGASINFQTKTLQKKPYATYQATVGSFNTYKNSIMAGTGLLNGRFSVDFRLSGLESSTFIEYGDLKHNSFFVSANYYTPKSLVKFNVLHGKEHTGITWWGVPAEMLDINRSYNPAGEYVDSNGEVKYYEDQSDNYQQDHYQLFYNHQFNNNLNFNAALHYTKGGGYYEQYKDDDDFVDYGLPAMMIINQDTFTTSDIIRQKWLKNDFYGALASVQYQKNKMQLQFGGAWNKYDGDHFGKILWMEHNINTAKGFEWYLNQGIKTEANLYSKLNYQLNDKLQVYADVQYRNIDYKMSGPDDDQKILDQEHLFHFINPKGGLYYNLSNHQDIFFSVSNAHREPTRANFKEATGDDSATPKAESLIDYELGYEKQWNHSVLSLNLYYMDYKDQLIPTGEKSNVGYDIMTNVPESYRRGIELSYGINRLSWLNWQTNLTLSQNRIKNFTEYSTYYTEDWDEIYYGKDLGETKIAYSPEVIASSILGAQVADDFDIKLISRFVGKQYFDNTSSEDRMIDPYFVNHLSFSYTLNDVLFKEISFRFDVRNLFNTSYISNAYGGNWYEGAVFDNNNRLVDAQQQTWAYYFPQAGIHFFGGIKIRF